MTNCSNRTLGIQIAQCRQYSQTVGPNVGIISVLGSLGIVGGNLALSRPCTIVSSNLDKSSPLEKVFGPFLHYAPTKGTVSSLEDWFLPRRERRFIPTIYRMFPSCSVPEFTLHRAFARIFKPKPLPEPHQSDHDHDGTGIFGHAPRPAMPGKGAIERL